MASACLPIAPPPDYARFCPTVQPGDRSRRDAYALGRSVGSRLGRGTKDSTSIHSCRSSPVRAQCRAEHPTPRANHCVDRRSFDRHVTSRHPTRRSPSPGSITKSTVQLAILIPSRRAAHANKIVSCTNQIVAIGPLASHLRQEPRKEETYVWYVGNQK
jgi:hypothetical protein